MRKSYERLVDRCVLSVYPGLDWFVSFTTVRSEYRTEPSAWKGSVTNRLITGALSGGTESV